MGKKRRTVDKRADVIAHQLRLAAAENEMEVLDGDDAAVKETKAVAGSAMKLYMNKSEACVAAKRRTAAKAEARAASAGPQPIDTGAGSGTKAGGRWAYGPTRQAMNLGNRLQGADVRRCIGGPATSGEPLVKVGAAAGGGGSAAAGDGAGGSARSKKRKREKEKKAAAAAAAAE
jgi:hypothetical protein